MAEPPDKRPRSGGGAGGRSSSSSRRRRRRRPTGSSGAAASRSAGAGQPAARTAAPGSGSPRRRTGSRPASRGAPSTAPARAGTDVSAAVVPSSAPAEAPAGELSRAVVHNRRRALTLCGAPAVIVLGVVTGVGAALGALVAGLVAGVVLGALCALGLWRGSAKVVLRALRATPVDEEDVPGPFTQVEWLCATMGLAPPALYRVEDALPNAVVIGRKPQDAALVLTTGLLEALDPVGVEGVLAHELAHLKRHDPAPATVAAALVLVSGVGAGAGGALVHRLAGRGREFEADRMAVQATRYPPGLRQALATLSEGTAASTVDRGSADGLAERRIGQITRWLFTVVLPARPGRRSPVPDLTGELDAPSVRIAALDEW